MRNHMVWQLTLLHSLVANNAYYSCDELRFWFWQQQLARVIKCAEEFGVIFFLFLLVFFLFFLGFFLFFFGIVLTPVFLF